MDSAVDTKVEETIPVEEVKSEPVVKKVTTTKQKDPKRVELGKKLAAHNNKIKEQNAKLRETAEEIKAAGGPPEDKSNDKYKWYALAGISGLGVALYLFRKVVNKPVWSYFDNKSITVEKPQPKIVPKPIETNSITDME